jgi:hypothetical protein
LESNLAANVVYFQPQTEDERRTVASACTLGLHLTIPTLLDDMENTADRTYNGWPERLYVLSTEGRIAYQGGKGPYGFDLDEMAQFLADYLA